MSTVEVVGLPPPLAKIEGDEIVIRVPLAAIPHAAQLALSEHGYSTDDNAWTRIEITDPRAFAADMCRAMNDESEDGSTRVHLLLDAAVCIAYEQGSEGAEEATLPTKAAASPAETKEPT